MLPWDALFLAGFAYSGYRTLGRWLKYTDDVAKSQSGMINIDLSTYILEGASPTAWRKHPQQHGVAAGQ